MTTPAWSASTTYLPGDLVTPRTTAAATPADLTNPGFESGDTGWSKGSGWAILSGNAYSGTWSAKHTGSGTSYIMQATAQPVSPGTTITVSAVFRQGSGSKDKVTGRVIIRWLNDADETVGSEVLGTNIVSSSGGTWKTSTATGTAPAAATKVLIGGRVVKTQSAECAFDGFAWNYSIPAVPDGLVYKAVQSAPGLSGADEPSWPTTLGVQVVDNEVTWEATQASRIVWEAEPILRSGDTEPDWPTEPGAVVSDGTIAWECISRVIEDEKCPHSKIVAIGASKVFCADDDIVRFSATVNPLDWSTADDAGYLPTGLQQYGSNPALAMNLYRSNLVVFNSQGFQMWQIDEDPQNMALLDSLPIGSRHHWGMAPVSNDLFFLSSLGVRSVGIAGASTNLQAGDVGMPVDPLVRASINAKADAGSKALATYYPSAGQFWLTTTVNKLTISGNVPDGYVGDAYDSPFECHNGVPPYTYALIAGGVMTGCVFDPNDSPLPTVNGTATTVGVFTFTIRGTDSEGNTADSPQVVTILGPESTFLLSHPYPVITEESLATTPVLESLRTLGAQFDSVQVGADWSAGVLNEIVESYEDAIPEGLQAASDWTAGVLTEVVVSYEDGIPESVQAAVEWSAGTLVEVVVDALAPEESVQASADWSGGTLTEV